MTEVDDLTLSIGDLARRTGVDISTLRRWERYEGLLAPTRTPGGQRRYGPADVAAVQELVSLMAKGWAPATAARAVASHRDTGAVVFDASVLDAVPAGVVVTNADTEVLYANPAIAALLGATAPEVLGADGTTFLDEEQRERVARAFEGLRRGEPQTYEVRMQTRGGDLVDVEVAAGPLQGPGGQYRGVVGIFRDIRQVKALQQHADRIAALLDASSEALAVVDAEGVVVDGNLAAAQLGLGPGARVDVLPAVLAVPTMTAIRRAVGGEASAFELRTPSSEGTHIDKQVRVLPADDGAIVVLVDVATASAVPHDTASDTAYHGVVAALTQAILSGASAGAVLETAVRGIGRALGATHVSFVEVVAPGGDLVVLASTTPGEAGRPAMTSEPFGSHVGFAIQSRRPIVVQDFAAERRFDRGSLRGEQEARSGICVPVRWRPNSLGAVSVHSADEHRDLGPTEVTFVQSAANVCALALEGRDGPTTEETR